MTKHNFDQCKWSPRGLAEFLRMLAGRIEGLPVEEMDGSITFSTPCRRADSDQDWASFEHTGAFSGHIVAKVEAPPGEFYTPFTLELTVDSRYEKSSVCIAR